MAKRENSRGDRRRRPAPRNNKNKPTRQEGSRQPESNRQLENNRAREAGRVEPPKKGKGLLIGLICFIVVVLLGTGYIFVEITGAFRGTDKEYRVTVAEGATAKDVAKELKESGAVGSETLFGVYARFTKKSADFKQGAFKFKGGSYNEICDTLSSEPNDIKAVTIVEGENLVEIAEKVAAVGVCTKDEFIAEANKDHGFYFESQLTSSKKVLFKYEGFLYPDTYYYNDTDTAKTMVMKMKKNFDDKLQDEDYARMKEMGLTLRETVALASVIQKEAGEIKEMKRVSSVFHNRLASTDLNMLQSSVTTLYVRNIVKVYKPKDTAMQNNYNTYETAGIPPGPICNPGIDAIEATLHPANSQYLYFLTDDRWNYYYAKTFAEHKVNLEKAEKVNNEVAKEKGNS